MGGIKDMLSPPMSKHGGDISPPSPPGFTPLMKVKQVPQPIMRVESVSVSKFNINKSVEYFLKSKQEEFIMRVKLLKNRL